MADITASGSSSATGTIDFLTDCVNANNPIFGNVSAGKGRSQTFSDREDNNVAVNFPDYFLENYRIAHNSNSRSARNVDDHDLTFMFIHQTTRNYGKGYVLGHTLNIGVIVGDIIVRHQVTAKVVQRVTSVLDAILGNTVVYIIRAQFRLSRKCLYRKWKFRTRFS